MELQNAVVNFLGDSITAGSGASCTANRYTDVLARTFQLKAANNYGISGSRIARQRVISSAPMDRDFCMRYTEMDEQADAVVVFGGTNDFGHGDAPLGSPEDRQPDTFRGACHYLMNGLLTRYTGKPVVILTPLHRTGEDLPRMEGTQVRNVTPLRMYREILMETAALYALPVLDLYATSGIAPSNDACRQLLLPDGLHPSDAGHALLARRIGLFLQTL